MEFWGNRQGLSQAEADARYQQLASSLFLAGSYTVAELLDGTTLPAAAQAGKYAWCTDLFDGQPGTVSV